MKKSLKDVDEIFQFDSSNSKITERLKRLHSLEESIEQSWNKNRRLSYMLNSDLTIKTKILRTFIRHKYVHETSENLSHYLLNIEGCILDPVYTKEYKFCNFFEGIKVVIESSGVSYEWNVSSLNESRNAECLQIKIPGDKSIPIKIYFTRTKDIRQRYELPSSLRDILPKLPIDSTEEDIMIALLHYICENGLLDIRDKRVVKCNTV
jgi:hypothetical protein